MNRKKTWLLSWGLAWLLAGAAWGQSYQDQIAPFAPPDLSLYGDAPGRNQGYFGSVEALNWSISAPHKEQFGLPREIAIPDVVIGLGLGEERSTHDTGGFTSDVEYGHRIEAGFAEGNHGWTVSYFGLNGKNQNLYCSNADVVFQDAVIPNIFPAAGFLSGFTNLSIGEDAGGGGGGGQLAAAVDDNWDGDFLFGRFFDGDGDGIIDPTNSADQLEPLFYDFGDLKRLPVVFRELHSTLKTEIWGIEFMPMYRSRPTHRAGYFDFTAGIRFMEYDEQFNVRGVGGILDESYWNTRAFNNLVGPQVGIRWQKTKGRFTISADGRFFAAWNFQTIRQKGALATQLEPTIPNLNAIQRVPGLPAFLSRTQFTNNEHETEWAPVAELRIQSHFRLTRAFSVFTGWNGMFADGIARPVNMVRYAMPTMGILPNNREDVFVQGVNFGIEINR